MKGGGGLSWGVMDVGTSRHGRHDVGTPELSLSVPNQHFGRLCKHTQKNEYTFPIWSKIGTDRSDSGV